MIAQFLTVAGIFAGGLFLVPCLLLMYYAYITPRQHVGSFPLTDNHQAYLRSKRSSVRRLFRR